jgi:hypothetical protein
VADSAHSPHVIRPVERSLVSAYWETEAFSHRRVPKCQRSGYIAAGRLGFGAMRITGRGIWGPPPDRAAAIRLLRRVVELGIMLIDTLISTVPASARS